MKHLLLLYTNAGMVNIAGTVKLAGGVVLHCAEQYPQTISVIITTANMMAPVVVEIIVSTQLLSV